MQQMRDCMGRSTSSTVGLSILVLEAAANHSKPLQLVLQERLGRGQRWSWPFGIATAAPEVETRSSASNTSATESCLQEIQTFEAFQIFLSEGLIYFF